MKRKFKILFWIIITLLLITNWPAFKNVTGLNDWYYRYSNISGTFTVMEIPIQGRMFKKPPKGEVTFIYKYSKSKSKLGELLAINENDLEKLISTNQ